MKNKIKIIIAAILSVAFCLTGCNTQTVEQNDKYKIVCSIFPQYDWVNNIVGDCENIEVSLLVDNGVDLHSYQATADDIITISQCDMFIYVGGESDKWVEEVLKQANNESMVVIDMMDVLSESIIEETVIEGMTQNEHEHGDEDEHDDTDSHNDTAEHDDEEIEYDEHVWLSIENAKTICSKIAECLINGNVENETVITANLEAYLNELDSIDKEYKDAMEKAENNTIIFGDRFPFSYLVNEYNINYYAAFVGCSAETEASFETVKFLANKLDEYNIDYIFIVDNSNANLAQSIIDNSNKKDRQILTLNSMQSVTDADISNGANYCDIMRDNLENIKTALSIN